MSRFDYMASRELEAQDAPFFALIMAAMRRADTDNAKILRAAFPDTWAELEARYNAPGGFLPAESQCDGHGNLDYGGGLNGFTRSCPGCPACQR